MAKGITQKELTEQFNGVYACGHSNLKMDLDLLGHKVFITKAKGSRVWDADGNEYIDYLQAFGPNILGHGNEEYINALKDYLDSGRNPVLASGIWFSEDDVELGQKIVQHVPSAEKIKFCISGTDAVQMAIRLARAYTNRPRFIRFAGEYHGWADNTLGGVLDPDAVGRPYAVQGTEADLKFTKGKAPGTNEESYMIPFNDIEALENVLKQYGDEIALILTEPLLINHFCMMPKAGYLEKLRSLCDDYGIVLCFDEVISGFRMGLGGAQAFFGVTPDLTTFGKSIAGGLPLSAVVGKSNILDLMKDRTVLGPGTFNAFPLATRAALTTIKILERDNFAIHKHIEKQTNCLKDGFKEIFKRHDIPVRVQGTTGVFSTVFGADPEKTIETEQDILTFDRDKTFSFFKEMQKSGLIYLYDGRWFISAAVNDKDVTETLEKVDEILIRV